MVAIVSGIRPGLDLGSREVLGAGGVLGNAQAGRNREGVYVNVANGLLVVQSQDDHLAARGEDAASLRTYNSGGTLNDDNGDNWSTDVVALRMSGTLHTAGSSLQRIDRDGSLATYSYDAARNLYVTTEGAGAYDTVSYIAADGQFEWRDGSTGATQRFEGSGSYRLLSRNDTSGNALTYSYGAGGFLSSVTTSGGESTFYDYTGSNLSQLRTVAGGVTTTRVRYGYDTNNRLATVTVDLTPSDNSVADGKVYQTTYTYDGTSRRIAGIAQNDGTSLAFTYVDVGGTFNVASVRDGLNQASTFAYGAGFTTVTDPLGLMTRYEYDGAGQLTRITAPAVAGTSASKQFAYNAGGDVISVTDGEGRSVTFQYDANGNQVLQRDALGNTVTRTFDARNQMVTETAYRQPDPDGAGAALPGGPATTRYVYDATGRNLLRFSISAEGRVTEHRYNGFGERVASIAYAGGTYAVSALAADAALSESQLSTWVASQDLTLTDRVDIAFDGRGQLQSRTSYARVSAMGEGIVDGSQSVEGHVYDAAGQLLQTVSPVNGITSFTYDGLGRALSTANALGQVQLTQYDDAASKTLVTLASGLVTTRAYDAAGRLMGISQSNASGAALGETKYFHDAGNRLRMTQDPTGVRNWILYDEAGRKTADIDGNGTMTEYSYDRADRVIRSFTWGTAVNTAALLDASGLPVMSATVATVRPPESAADHGVWRQYDAADRLVRVAEHWGTAARAAVTETRYDGASRVVQVVRYANTVPTDGTTGSVSAGSVPLPAASAQDRSSRNFYDAEGRLAGTLDAEGYLTAFTYTGAGRLSERIAYATPTDAALRAAGTLAQLTPAASAADIREVTLYDRKGSAIAQVDGEGHLTETVYDANGNVTQTVRYATRVAGTVSAASTLASLRPAATAADRATSRSYDALDRLTQETSPEGVVTQYAYDTAGNLTSTVRAVGTGEVRTLLARYDLQGRLTGELSAQGAALLTGGQTQAQIDAIWAQYGTVHAYDAASRRLSSTNALGHRTFFYYNADGASTHTVNALGEVHETRYDARGRVSEQVVYANRISTVGLTGGLAMAGFTSAVAAVANAAADSRTTISYTHDSRVASTTDALGTGTTVTYNTFGDEIGSQLTGTAVSLSETYTVDKRGLRTGTARDPAGVNAITSAVYDAFGRLVRSVDANGNLREQTYDRMGRVVTTRDPLDATRSSSYDAFGRVLTETDALGKVTSYAYNATARTMTVTTPEGIVSTTTSTRHGQIQSFADGKGQITSYSYDRNGKLLQTSTPLTSSSSTYDAAGRVTQTIDGGGNKVDYSYDAAGRVLTRRVDPSGLNLTTSYQYDGKGQRVSTTDANGVVTTVEYDRKGQVLTQTVDPTGLNLQTLYTYDARGNTLTVRSAGGTLTQYVYDALGRRIQERVDPTGLNLQRSWSYDRNGNVVSSTDARGNVTGHAYDADDRLVYTVDPLGNLRQSSYDAAGRVVKTVAYATPISTGGLAASPTAAQIQPLVISQAVQDVVEHRVYDQDGRVLATLDSTGGVVKFTYDAIGNVVSRTAFANRIDLATWAAGTVPTPTADAARDETLRTVYDALNRAVYTMDGIGAVVAQTYDGNGNVLQRTAYASTILTNTTFTQAGVAAAVAAVANPARDTTLRNTYDAAGRLTWSVDGTGAVTQRVYDQNGNLVRQVAYVTAIAAGASAASVPPGSNDRATAMAYDNANRLVLQVDALRGVTEQVFDADGHVVRRIAYANPIASVPALGTAATAAAIRSALTPDSMTDRSTRYGYDAGGRQALVIDALGAVTETQYDAAGNAIAVTAYGNLVSTSGLPATPTLAAMKALVTANAGSDRLSKNAYDAAGRLLYTVDPIGAVKAHQYDGIGQLTRSTQYAKVIAATTVDTAAAISAAIVVDAANDRVNAFSYNAAGQRVTSTDALNGIEWYTYDAVGRKLSFNNKKGFAWTYSYDAAGRMLTETTPQVALSSVSLDVAGNLAPGAVVNAGIVTRFTYDALGNLTQRTEGSGRPEERSTRYEYDAVGRQIRVIHPTVDVYDAAGDAVTTNGASGVASRVETPQTLETQTFHDALGNAVASRDVGSAISQKAYDLLGQVAYDIDALGYVTGYVRNAFGEVTALTRYGAATTLASAAVTQASQAASKAQVDAAISAAGVDHSRDRQLVTSHDRAGRVTEVIEPGVHVHDASTTGGTGIVGKTTRNTYDAFGQLVQVKALRNAADTWSTTTHYFDKGGRETATVDALGYLTTRGFDALGNETTTIDYATAVGGTWTTAAYTPPAAHADDRKTTSTYDRLDRKTSEKRWQVEFSDLPNGTSTRGDLTTTFGYDAVGNQTVVTDAGGNTTYTYYDALGRVSAIAAPPRSSTVTGAALTPLTAFRRDAYGNVVVKTEYANGAAGATSSAPAASDAADRMSLARYDSLGRSIQTTDANGASEFSSYDPYGHLAKKWQGVTGNDGVTRTAFEVNVYDKLGQLIESRSPASTSMYQEGAGISTVSQAQAGLVSTSIEYNGFGEVTRKGTQGGRQEYFEYDNAGRLWRTNTGDGVDRINLFDALGNVTAEIRSAGSGRDNIDIKGFASAQAAADNPSTRRVDIQYDALGRVTQKSEAARQELQGGVAVQRQYTTASIVSSAIPQLTEYGYGLPAGANKVVLTWNSLLALGSGDVKVSLEYRTPVVTSTHPETGGAIYSGGTLRSYTSGFLNGDQNASGATLQWAEDAANTADVGIAMVTRITVFKKDISGTWQVAVDQAPGYGGNEFIVAAPAAEAWLSLQLRTAGSSGDTGWWTAGLATFGNAYRCDASGLWAGNYEYRVIVASLDGTSRITGSGTVSITQPPLNDITTPVSYGRPWVAPGVMSWATPGTSYAQALRYRPSGSTGAWSSLPVISPLAGVDGVDTSGLAAGTYQFELLWTLNGQGVPSSHATGTFTVVAPKPAYWAPPVNLPPITGVSIGTGLAGVAIVGYDEAGAPMYAGGTPAPAIVWNAADATVARYRVAGGAWNNLAFDNTGQTIGESGPTGTQKAPLNGIPPGSYQVEILAGSPPTAQATGDLVIHAQNPGYWTTVYVQVPTYQPVIAYYAPVYETRYAQRQVAYSVWVSDPPYVAGYDEDGSPVYAYPGHWETRYYWESYSYQVQVGQTPVYATDENGNIIYQTIWVTQAQQGWVEGTTPAPTIAITTPPYTPGYWVAATPAQYGVTVSTVAGSGALSTTDGGVMSQSAGLNGDSRWLRPVIQQKVDRWGNVTEITDPRAAYWKTTYRYNANNQLVQQVLPDMGTGATASSIYYDKLGRQVASKDANGNVNGQAFDAAGNLVRELHADGGELSHAYNAFGDKLRTVDARQNLVAFSYDKLGQLLRTTRAQVLVYHSNGYAIDSVQRRNIEESWAYDQMGRKLSQTNGNGEVLKYAYDLGGNLVATQQPLGQTIRAAFDAQGRKIAEVDANGVASSWTYDYFGLLTGHVDLGGARYSYGYDNARQLTSQSSTRGQSISYSYDAAGQVTTIRDAADDKTTTYVYDLGGRKIRERAVQAGVTYQDNHLAYDARGNLRDVSDARAHVIMDYDSVGNRTHVVTFVEYQGFAGATGSTSDRYFQYDAMNRQIVVDAVDAAGNLGTQGHRISYDQNGNRTSDMAWGTKVVTSGGEQAIAGYNDDGSAIYYTTPLNYTAVSGYSQEQYRYDSLNRLQSVEKDGTQIDLRFYDGADRLLQSGPATPLPIKYSEIINQGVAPGEVNGKELRIYRYDANGRLMHHRLLKSDHSLKTDIYWDPSEGVTLAGTRYTPNGYDEAGNVLGYVVESHEAGIVNEYTTSLQRYEGYQAGVTNGVSSGQLPGSTTQQYDANGFLVAIVDSTQPNNNRVFVNDATGRALFVNQAGNIQRQLIVNGEVLGLYGAGVDPNKPASGLNNNPNFANVIDFDFGYARVSANYPTPSPGAYTVRTGDTLQSIAQSAYGDSALWYRIAEGNGLASNSDLKVGQTLNIANRVSTINNNNTTFKPYDPSRIEGDKTPNLATPKPKKKSGLGQLLMVIVAVIATIFTAGAAAMMLGAAAGATSTFAAGMAALAGGSFAGVTLTAGVMGSVAAASVASAAIGAAVGSIASQAIGIAAGVQDRFSWKSVAISSLSAGVTAGVGASGVLAGNANAVIGRGVLANVATQGIAIGTGLQRRFDWRGVAASAVGAGVGDAVAPAFGDLFGAGSFGQRLGAGLIAGAAVSLARGGRVVVQQVAVDAFGNALGSSLADAATSSGSPATQAPAPGQLGSGSYGVGDVDKLLFAGFAGPRPAVSAPQPVAIPDNINGLDLPAGVTYGPPTSPEAEAVGDAMLRNLRTVIVKPGQGPLAAMASAGLTPAEQRTGYGYLLASGQVPLGSDGVSSVQPGQELFIDLNETEYAGGAGRAIAHETSLRAERMAKAILPADPTVGDSAGNAPLYDTRLEASRIANARTDIMRTTQTDRVGDWIRSLNLPEIPGVGWLSKDQAVASAQHWAGRLDETGNPLYAVPQGVATLWADHAEDLGMVLSIRGCGRGVRAGESGAFGTLKGVKGDGLTAHHMPQAAAQRTGYNEGGALVLTHAEHVATRTYGTKGMVTLQSDAKLSFREVLARDIADIRSVVGSKYNEGLRNLTEYYRKNFPELMKK